MQEWVQDQEAFKQYLLGTLAPDKQQTIEERLLTEITLFDELLIAEDELIDDYLKDLLAPDERAAFDSHFLQTPERYRKLKFAGAFRQYIADAEIVAHEDVAEQINSFPQDEKYHGSVLPAPRATSSVKSFSVAALLILTLICGAVLLTLYSRKPAREEFEAAMRRERVPSVVVLTLTPESVRSAGELKRLDVNGVTSAEIRLKVTSNDYSSYRATLEKEGRATLTGEQLNREATSDGEVVVWNVPVRLLAGGDYRLKLSGVTSRGELEDVARYSFRVLTK